MPVRKGRDIDDILQNWEFEPGVLSARLIRARNGREVIQMRVEMGVLQMETEGRPDGTRPHGAETYLDYLISRALHEGANFRLTKKDKDELDREFMQYYHRRICWLALRKFRRSIDDANHTLAMMDFIGRHCNDRAWVLSHHQYRPFVLLHRTQAAALAELENGRPEEAVELISEGMEEIEKAFAQVNDNTPLDKRQVLGELQQLQDTIREEYHVGRTLRERLADAVAAEQYELAAKLRDAIRKRNAHLEADQP